MEIASRRSAALVIALVLFSALLPREAASQESPGETPAAVLAQDPGAEASPAVTTLRAASSAPDLLRLPVAEEGRLANEPQPLALPQESGRGRGKAFMIAGAAALIGGIIVGGDLGTVIAAGGVVLGAYGVILYF